MSFCITRIFQKYFWVQVQNPAMFQKIKCFTTLFQLHTCLHNIIITVWFQITFKVQISFALKKSFCCKYKENQSNWVNEKSIKAFIHLRFLSILQTRSLFTPRFFFCFWSPRFFLRVIEPTLFRGCNECDRH